MATSLLQLDQNYIVNTLIPNIKSVVLATEDGNEWVCKAQNELLYL